MDLWHGIQLMLVCSRIINTQDIGEVDHDLVATVANAKIELAGVQTLVVARCK